MAKTYYACDGSDNCYSRQVTMTVLTGCNLDSYSGTHGIDYQDTYLQTLRFTLDSALPAGVNLTVYFTLDYHDEYYDNWYSGSYDETQTHSVTIVGGTTTKDYEFECLGHRESDMGAGGIEYYTVSRTNPTLIVQPTIPVCCLAPTGVTCTIAIDQVTITDCTTRGDSTGSIEICITGGTGNTTWKLNGVTKVSGYTQQCFSYTGLTAGEYTVAITDSTGCTAQDTYTILDGEFRTGDFTVFAPTGLTAVENPIIIQVETAINSPSPKENITTLTVAGTIANNLSLQFNLTSPYVYSQTFYAKAYPNKPNYFLASVLNNQSGVAVGTNTTTEITTSLADALNNDAILPKVYHINNDGTVITLTAKQYGSRFNLDDTNVISSASGITVTQTQAGVDAYDGQITDNYSISCEVMANTDYTNQYPMTGDSADYNKIAELILPFSENNRHRFDISGILKSQVSTPKPDITFTGATYLPTPMQPYYVKLSEMYPLVPNTNTVKKRYKTTTVPAWVINSSLNRYVANDMRDYVNVPVKFLTNSPNPKQIQRGSKEFLYFVLPKNYGTDLSCIGDMYFYDGTQVTGVTFFSIATGTTNTGGVMMMNISYDKLGLGNYEVSGTTNRKIKRIELAVYASGGTIQYTEEKQFRFEIDEMPRKFGIFFQNALGMYDALDFIGVIEETISRETGTYTVPIDYSSTGAMPTGQKHVATYDTKIAKKLICNTGWVDSETFDWLREMLQSNNIYASSTAYSNYLNLTEWTYKKSSLDDLFSMEVTFEYTVFENNISV